MTINALKAYNSVITIEDAYNLISEIQDSVTK